MNQHDEKFSSIVEDTHNKIMNMSDKEKVKFFDYLYTKEKGSLIMWYTIDYEKLVKEEEGKITKKLLKRSSTKKRELNKNKEISLPNNF